MSTLKLSEFVKYKTAIVMFNLLQGILPTQLQRLVKVRIKWCVIV